MTTKIYTKTGDSGHTALFGGGRVSKGHPRVEAYGSVDELNSVLGLAISMGGDDTVTERLETLQHDLFTLGAELATPPRPDGKRPAGIPDLPLHRIAEMEEWIDEAVSELPDLKAFILPGGVSRAAALHMARTVCRRAERAVVTLSDEETVQDGIVRYLNRLSDLLFTLARMENRAAGRADVHWQKER